MSFLDYLKSDEPELAFENRPPTAGGPPKSEPPTGGLEPNRQLLLLGAGALPPKSEPVSGFDVPKRPVLGVVLLTPPFQRIGAKPAAFLLSCTELFAAGAPKRDLELPG